MTKILGISAYYHDSACALIEDGKIIAAAQEERFTRKKHDQEFPSNAIKYCHSGDMIEITTRVKKDNVAVISVRDTGIGIPKEKIPKILSDQFFSTSGTRNEKGTGLGLMLCKDFVTRNGGEFWVNSTSGEGSSFYFTLPINPPSE